MKTTVFIITMLFTFHISAQDPIMQKDNEALEAIATKITKTYDDEGNLEEEIIYEHGVEKSRKEYKKN